MTDLPPAGQLLFTFAEAAALLSVSERTVYALVADGTLPTVQVRSLRRISRVALESFARDDGRPLLRLRPRRRTG